MYLFTPPSDPHPSVGAQKTEAELRAEEEAAQLALLQGVEITAEEDEEARTARAAAWAAAHPPEPAAPPVLPWFTVADLALPEEPPPVRSDAPEDTLEPLWVHGYGSAAAPRMRRNTFYTTTVRFFLASVPWLVCPG